MKQQLLTLASLLLALPGLGQTPVTLTAATYPAAPGTVERYQDANLPTNAAATVTGANQSWDYRNLATTGGPYSFTYLSVPAGTSVAGAQWSRARTATIGGIAYAYNSLSGLGNGGVLALGRSVVRQAYALTALTGSTTDSIVINKQTALYNGTAGVVDLPLPLTAGSYQTRTFRFGVTGQLTAAALGYNKAPLRVVQRFLYADSVAGWGTVQVPVAGRATGSPALAVLLVRSRTIRQDSFYVNGTPAPATLLAGFGVTQGQVTRFYNDSFRRPGSVQPVLDLYYSSAQYGTPYTADYSVEASLLAARPAALPGGAVAWPNPLSATDRLRVVLPGARPDQPVGLVLYDAQGRCLLAQTLPLLAGVGEVPAAATAALAPGLYLLTVRQGERALTLHLVRH